MPVICRIFLIISFFLFSLPAHSINYKNVFKFFLNKTSKKSNKFIRSKEEIIKTNIGGVTFRNTLTKGRFGERLTAKRLTGMGYKKLYSKYDKIRGIDGVYIKNIDNKISELVITETKVGKASLNPGPPKQMSDEWILERSARLESSSNKEASYTGRLILNAFKNNNITIKKQLWRHNIENNTTVVNSLNSNAEIISKTYSWRDKMITNELSSWCKRGRIQCFNN